MIVYEFGKNWQKYLDENLSEERVIIAQAHMLKFFRLPNLAGKTFLDVGCGSGIHSLAAILAGAEKVVSIDIDPESVQSCSSLHKRFGAHKNWSIIEGSILDECFVRSLGTFDLVYSWGVLHHTGNMWSALKNICIPLNRAGTLYVALYADEVYQNPSPEYWIKLKEDYNKASAEEKRRMEQEYAWQHILAPIAQEGNNPLIYMENYKSSRGMEFWTDVRDWLGGYPIEFSTTSAVCRFFSTSQQMELLDVSAGKGNTEFLFRHKNSSNYWDSILDTFKRVYPTGKLHHREGYSYYLPLDKNYQDFCDDNEHPNRSSLLMFEDGTLLGFPHAIHNDIARKGQGRFSHWKDHLVFSASDNSDPRTNGRTYELRIPE